MKTILVAATCLLGGAVLAWRLKPEPPLPAVLQQVDTLVVTKTQLVASAPRVEPRTVDRIVYREVPPELVMVGRDSVPPESSSVEPPDSARTDSGADEVAPTVPYVAGRYGSGKLDLWIGRSDSSVLYQRHRVHAPFDFVTDSAGVHVHEQRAWLRVVKGAARCGGAAAVGAGAGALLVGKDRLGGAIVGAAAGCAGTIVF